MWNKIQVMCAWSPIQFSKLSDILKCESVTFLKVKLVGASVPPWHMWDVSKLVNDSDLNFEVNEYVNLSVQ